MALKETTLAHGASVPMTKAEPEVVPGLETELPDGHAATCEQEDSEQKGSGTRQRAAIEERMRAWVDIVSKSLSAVPGSLLSMPVELVGGSGPGRRESVRAMKRESSVQPGCDPRKADGRVAR